MGQQKRLRIGSSIAAAAYACVLVGCSVLPGTRSSTSPKVECLISGAPSVEAASFTVAISMREYGQMREEAFRLLGGHPIIGPAVLPTLVTQDCSGAQLQSGLQGFTGPQFGYSPILKSPPVALPDNRGIAITFDQDAQYADGSPITAASVAKQWQRIVTPALPIDSIRAIDYSRLNVYSDLPSDRLIKMLADPVFSLGIVGVAGQLFGSSKYVVRSDDGRNEIHVEAVREQIPSIKVIGTSGDLRDLLPSTVDVALTSEDAVVEYARSVDSLMARELRVDDGAGNSTATGATYVIVTRARLELALKGSGRNPSLSVANSFKEALATTAVRDLAEAYAANQLQADPAECSISRSVIDPVGSSRREQTTPARIVLESDDRIAIDIADRMVALLNAYPDGAYSDNVEELFPGFERSSGVPIPTVLPPEDFRKRLEGGSDDAYIIRLFGSPIAQCLQLNTIVQAAPWLQEGFRLSDEFAVPLLRKRQFLVAATNKVPAMYLGGRGEIRFGPPRRVN